MHVMLGTLCFRAIHPSSLIKDWGQIDWNRVHLVPWCWRGQTKTPFLSRKRAGATWIKHTFDTGMNFALAGIDGWLNRSRWERSQAAAWIDLGELASGDVRGLGAYKLSGINRRSRTLGIGFCWTKWPWFVRHVQWLSRDWNDIKGLSFVKPNEQLNHVIKTDLGDFRCGLWAFWDTCWWTCVDGGLDPLTSYARWNAMSWADHSSKKSGSVKTVCCHLMVCQESFLTSKGSERFGKLHPWTNDPSTNASMQSG